MAKSTGGDDLEAVRAVVTALTGFGADEQERILRWAREKLGLSGASPQARSETRTPPLAHQQASPRTSEPAESQQQHAPTKDLKTFVKAKNPKSDVQFAATVAYYYRFEAPAAQRKDEIDATILQDSCRLADRSRFTKPGQTLRNSKNLGLLDSGSEAGKFVINTVGENLVAMTLPGPSEGDSGRKPRPRKPSNKTTRRRK